MLHGAAGLELVCMSKRRSAALDPSNVHLECDVVGVKKIRFKVEPPSGKKGVLVEKPARVELGHCKASATWR